MLLENYEDAANFVGARPKSKLKPVSRTAKNALQHSLLLVHFKRVSNIQLNQLCEQRPHFADLSHELSRVASYASGHDQISM